jgi:hypothetical protein
VLAQRDLGRGVSFQPRDEMGDLLFGIVVKEENVIVLEGLDCLSYRTQADVLTVLGSAEIRGSDPTT